MKEEFKPLYLTEAPYVTSCHTRRDREKYEKHAREYYAIGVIILEIMIGTEFVMVATHEGMMRRLVENVAAYIDKETYVLLEWLILDEGVVGIKRYVDEVLINDGDKIKDNILRLHAAIPTDTVLRGMLKSFEDRKQEDLWGNLQENQVQFKNIDRNIKREAVRIDDQPEEEIR